MLKIAILGFGREGQSLLRFFKQSPKFKNAEVWMLDKRKKLALPRGIHAYLGSQYLEHLKEFNIIFRSPGIPYLLPEIQAAKKHGVEISSATKLFFEELNSRFLQNLPPTTYQSPCIIGVTGTKGKGTTCTLLYKILKAAGKKVYLAGNIGKPALDLLSTHYSLPATSCIILELSSFQLQDLNQSPHIAAVLDMFPDHQDAHTSVTEYYRAKENIAFHQKKADSIFFFAKNPISRRIAYQSPGKKIAVDETQFDIFSLGDLKLVGMHNFKNAVMAATIARSLKISRAVITRTVMSFRGNEHRLELVRTLHGVRFYNDSSSTNPHTTAAAIQSFQIQPANLRIKLKIPVVVIVGGQDKNLDYAPLANALKKHPVKLVVLMGENTHKIKHALQGTNCELQVASSLKNAVHIAYRYSKLKTPYPADTQTNSKFTTILFSPGATSFDMFKDYADRGEQFKELVRKLR
ncbi:MAG: UDP-N-acetylmuramoyl-L-alanine--D-glutamate ligase [Patescibacteria group bacterium]|nr:UDP-N-acetylmuramoyl-L-alanine--D-glutamate ligase [Patescibacteria group bacterium]